MAPSLLRDDASASALSDAVAVLVGRTRKDSMTSCTASSAARTTRPLRSGEFIDMAYDVVLRTLAVIREAVRALPEATLASIPDAPWASIAGLRNVEVHEDFRVDP